jgi:hypothetical protein
MKSADDKECSASIWKENFEEQYQEEDGTIRIDDDATPDTIWKVLDETFGDKTEKQLAEIKLQHFYQGKQTFQEYIQEFEIFAMRARYVLKGDKAHNSHLISLLEKQVHSQMID